MNPRKETRKTALTKPSESALDEGRFGEAIRLLTEACAWHPEAVELKERLFATLRQAAIQHHLIDLYLDRMGWKEDQYQGFSKTGLMSGTKEIVRQLDEFRQTLDATDDSTLTMDLSLLADRIAWGSRIIPDDFGPHEANVSFAAAKYFLLGKMASKKGHFEKAMEQLLKAVNCGIPFGIAHRLLGRVLWRLKENSDAMFHINLAQGHPCDHWSSAITQSWAETAFLGTYKGFNIHYHNEYFIGVPEATGIHIDVQGSEVTFLQNRVPREIRMWLRERLPEWALQTLIYIINIPAVNRLVNVKTDASGKVVVATNITAAFTEIDRRYAVITSDQIRAACAILRWSAKKLSEESGVSLPTIQRMEDVEGVPWGLSRNLDAIRRTLEWAGIEFLEENNKEPSVRLRASRKGD